MDYKLNISPIRSYRIEPVIPSNQTVNRHLTFNEDSFTSDTSHYDYKTNEEEIVTFGSPLADEKTRPHTSYYSPADKVLFQHPKTSKIPTNRPESPFAFRISNFRTCTDPYSDLRMSKYENKIETPNDSFEHSDYYTKDLPRLSLKDIQETEREYQSIFPDNTSDRNTRRDILDQDQVIIFDRKHQIYPTRDGYTDQELDEVELEQQLKKMREDEEYLKLSFESKFFNPKWQIRKRTYEEISECFKAKRNLFVSGSQAMNDVFGEFEGLLRDMTMDSNLVCQFEGLKCLYVYLTCVHEIKSSVIGLLDELISKCNTNKPAYNDTLMATLIEALVREEQGMLLYKVCNRLDTRNSKEAIFCIKVLENTIEKLDLNEGKYKMILEATLRALKHNLATVRSAAVFLARSLYQSVSLSLDEFLKTLGDLKSIILKEIKEVCIKSDKYSKILRLPDVSSYSAEPEKQNSLRDQAGMLLTEDSLRPKEDVMNLISPEFFKLPYETDVKNKRKILSCVNSTVLTGSYSSQPDDYLPIVHVFFHLLEETNSLIYSEVMKLMGLLIPKIPHTFAIKGKQLVKHLVEKFKEKKHSIKIEAKKILTLIRKYEIIPHDTLLELLVDIAAEHKNPQVREYCLIWIKEEIENTGRNIDLLSGAMLEKPWYCDIIAKVSSKTSQKLLEILKKDVAGSVRDTAVALLGTYKSKLEEIGSCSDLNTIIQKLPKNRINEIKKQKAKTIGPTLAQTNLIELDYSAPSGKVHTLRFPENSFPAHSEVIPYTDRRISTSPKQETQPDIKNVVDFNIEDIGFEFNKTLGTFKKGRDPIELYSFDESVHSKLMDYAESVCNTERSESVCENLTDFKTHEIIPEKHTMNTVTESILLDFDEPIKPPRPTMSKPQHIKRTLSALEISSPSVTGIPTTDFFSFMPSCDLNTTSTFNSDSKSSTKKTLLIQSQPPLNILPHSTQAVFIFDTSANGILNLQSKLMYSENPSVEISQPMKVSYKAMKFVEDRKRYVHGVLYALSNQDILHSLDTAALTAMIDTALYFCIFEKMQGEYDNRFLSETMSIGQDMELTALLQKLVGVLLESRDTSIILIILIKCLNKFLPGSFYLPISEEAIHGIKLYIKCITKLVDSISYERMKVFEVFISLYRIFEEHPPEKLNSDSPNVQIYEHMFRLLRSISDKLIAIEPNRVQAFLQFCIRSNPESTTSIYVKYLAGSLLKKYNLKV